MKLFYQRLLHGIIVLFFLITITFFAIRLIPGDPLTDEKSYPPHVREKIESFYHLDKPLITQYFYYLSNLLKGDLGPSISKQGKAVVEIIKQAFPVSLFLGTIAMLIALIVGIPSGIISAYKQNSKTDFIVMTLAMIGICVPSFVIGPLLAKYIGLNFSFINVAGFEYATDWILPSITLSAGTAAYLARMTRASMLDVLSQEYIKTAKTKGASIFRIIILHSLRPTLIPIISFIGPTFAALISGSFVIETIFQIPGIGQHFINATTSRDYFLIQGIVLLYGGLIIFSNFIADIIHLFLDPRTKKA